MANMNRVAQIEMGGKCDDVGDIGVHIVAVLRLARPAVTPAVVGDAAESLVEEEQHLVVPIVRTGRPAVVEANRLSIPQVQSL